MSKEMKSRREGQKKPMYSLKEKRARKRSKKEKHDVNEIVPE